MDRKKCRSSDSRKKHASCSKPRYSSRQATTKQSDDNHGDHGLLFKDESQKEDFVQTWISQTQPRPDWIPVTVQTMPPKIWRPHNLPIPSNSLKASDMVMFRDSSIIPEPAWQDRPRTTSSPHNDDNVINVQNRESASPRPPSIVRNQFRKSQKRTALPSRYEKKKKRPRNHSEQRSGEPTARPLQQSKAVNGDDLMNNFRSTHISKSRITVSVVVLFLEINGHLPLHSCPQVLLLGFSTMGDFPLPMDVSILKLKTFEPTCD